MTNARLSQRLSNSLRRANYLVQAAVLSAAAAVPIITNAGTVHAGQLTSRYIDMSDGGGNAGGGTAEGSGRDGGDPFGDDVTYQVSFNLATAHANLEGIVVEFCNLATGPIINTTCTAPAGFDTNYNSGLVLANQVGISGFAIDTTNSTANKVIITETTGTNLASAATVTFDLGSTGGADGITNPTSAGTFYARIVTYTDSVAAEGYTSTDVDAGVGPAHTDDGGIALAVANELTISARVQEQLQFCVGTTDSGGAGDCTDISGTAINLGVVDSTAITETPDNAGKAMIRTNAFNGATISYKAEQNTSSGQLKVAGATCAGTLTDQCFNSTGTTQNTIVAGTEEFGMTLTNVDTTNGTTAGNLQCDAEYNGDGTCNGAGAITDYAWDDSGAFDIIASSSASGVKVIDDEMITMKFAATASATTPTGLYTTTANFVATATF